MCGIVGVIGRKNAPELLLESLKKLEYRGYDSAGIALLSNGNLEILKEKGRIENLEKVLKENTVETDIGIGHTRWATHGKATTENAHPHFTDKVAVVHNGIIENYKELRQELMERRYSFRSETDTEVIAWLLTDYLNKGYTPERAVKKTISKLKGSYALAIIFTGYPDLMIGARNGSPLGVGYTTGEGMFLGSDAVALSSFTDTVCYLEDGDIVTLTKEKAIIENKHGLHAHRKIKKISVADEIDKNGYEHYMLKEIFEQPKAIEKTLASLYDEKGVFKKELPDFSEMRKILLIGCGTSYYAALVAKYWFEKLCRITVETDVGSEFRYRDPHLEKGNAALFMSQSGETADTLAALKYCKEKDQKIISIVNTEGSSIDRESDFSLYTQAGVEIGVASTKAFTTQLIVLLCFAIELGKANGKLSKEEGEKILQTLQTLPEKLTEIFQQVETIKSLAKEIEKSRGVLYLARGINYPIAMEGALKLKELSYMYAEAYAAGEMKHGPIALIDSMMPVVVIAPYNNLFEKTVSNIEEVRARGGKVILVSDKKGCEELKGKVFGAIEIPQGDFYLDPILSVIPMQLLSYDVSLIKGNDIDKPRNLAKSVTVE